MSIKSALETLLLLLFVYGCFFLCVIKGGLWEYFKKAALADKIGTVVFVLGMIALQAYRTLSVWIDFAIGGVISARLNSLFNLTGLGHGYYMTMEIAVVFYIPALCLLALALYRMACANGLHVHGPVWYLAIFFVGSNAYSQLYWTSGAEIILLLAAVMMYWLSTVIYRKPVLFGKRWTGIAVWILMAAAWYFMMSTERVDGMYPQYYLCQELVFIALEAAVFTNLMAALRRKKTADGIVTVEKKSLRYGISCIFGVVAVIAIRYVNGLWLTFL